MPIPTEIEGIIQSPQANSPASVLHDARRAEKNSGLGVRFLDILKRGLHEPLVHFLLIGLSLFVLYGYRNRGQSGDVNHQIVISLDDIRQLDISFVSQWHRQPTPEEFRGLVEGFIRQEVLYREGLAMGLDKDDTIVKRRMAQKMEFLAEDVAASHEPTTEELKAWYSRNPEKFALADRSYIPASVFRF